MKESIFIFRTSITKKQEIKRIGLLLKRYPQILKWNVDFEDWEKILRIECRGIKASDIVSMLRSINVFAAELPV